MRATEIVGRPVVTLTGRDVAQVKDIVYDAASGNLGGFTLNGRGMFAGPLHQVLAWDAVLACGPDAVMIRDETSLTDTDALLERTGGDANVLGARVISHSGTDLGQVVDVIVQIASTADVVGYEIEASPALNTDRTRLLIPRPDTRAVSGEALMVPDAAIEFVSDDLAGFGAAVDTFRARLQERES